MKNHFFFGCIVCLTAFLLPGASSPAAGGASSSFFIDQAKPDHRWEIMAEGEIGWVRMKAVNDYISRINDDWHGDISKVRTAEGFSVRLVYRVNPHIGVGIGYEWLRAEASGDSAGGDFELETSAYGLLGLASLRYPLRQMGLALSAELALGYYRGDYEERENVWRQDGDDDTIGSRVEVKASYALARHIGIAAGGGYRYLKMDDFGVRFVSPGRPPVEVDYSGWFAGGGITVSW